MKLDQPSNLLVAELIKDHASNSYIDMTKFSHISDVVEIDTDNANTSCIVYLTTGAEHVAKYNRIDLSRLFGIIPTRLRKGKLDWSDVEKTNLMPNPKIYREVKHLYGVALESAVELSLSAGTYYLEALPKDPSYIGKTPLSFYDSRYTDIPFNLLRGFYNNKFKGDYTLMPMQPYQVGAFLLTSDGEYNPNGDIFGQWEQITPIITSGMEAELLRIPERFCFELLDLYVKTPNVEVICLNPGSEEYNRGNAELLNKQWRITNPNSPLYGEFINVVDRAEMTIGARTHLLIYKKKGHVANIDSPEFKWIRTE